MKKMKTITAYLMIFALVFVFSVTKAESFDSEAISQVSKGIAEWKLMNEDKSKTQIEQTVYVSRSLGGIAERGDGEGIGIVSGLVAFDNNNYWIESEIIRNWELSNSVTMSNRYIFSLPTNPWPDILTSIGSELTTRGIGSVYGGDNFGFFKIPPIGQSYNEIANVFRTQRGLGPTDAALQNTARGLGIYNASATIMGTAIQAADTFQKTVHYVGTSMQIMNPPIYLQNNPEDGQFVKFTPSQKILGIPVSGTWEGSGSYRISGGIVNYQETLKTSGHGTITQTHTDWETTNRGTHYRHIEIKTPGTNGFERFAVTHYPQGSYFDPTSSSIMTTTKIQQRYRIETIGGISKVTPLPSSGLGSHWNTSPPTFNATWKVVKLGDSTTVKYPSIDWNNIPKTNWNIPSTNWSIPKTNWTIPRINPLPTYTPSIPKMPTYRLLTCTRIPQTERIGGYSYTKYYEICSYR